MNKTFFSFLYMIPIVLFAVTGCESGGGGDDGGGDGGGGDGFIALTEDDFPDVSPCSDRDTLPDDADFIAAIDAAAEVRHIHVEYGGDDTLGAVCGKEGDWDPEDAAIVANEIFDPEIADFIEAHFLGISLTQICRSTFGFVDGDPPDDDALGFPEAGAYRGDGCISGGGNSYSFRARVTVSGDAADETYAENGIDSADDLAVFNADGEAGVTAQDAKDEVTASPGEFDLTVRSADGAVTYLDLTIEVICVKKLADGEECPAET